MSNPSGMLAAHQRLLIHNSIERARQPVDAIHAFLVGTTSALGWLGAVFYLVDMASPRMLTPVFQAHESGSQHEQVITTLANRRPAPDNRGLGGRVLDTGKPAWSQDVQQDPSVLLPEEKEIGAIRGALAVPIYLGGRLAAVAEFFSPEPLRPAPGLVEDVQQLSQTLGLKLRNPPADVALGGW